MEENNYNYSHDYNSIINDRDENPVEVAEKKDDSSSGNNLSFWLILLSIFITPLIFLPDTLADLTAVKFVTIASFLFLAIFAWIISKFKDNDFELPSNLLTFSIILVPVAYILSAVFSENPGPAFFGRDFGYDGAAIFTVLFLSLVFISGQLKEKEKSFKVYLAVLSSICIVSLFQILQTVFPNQMPNFGFFNGPSIQTIGKWYDLAVFAGIGVLLSLISLEFLKLKEKKATKIFFISSLILSLITMALVGFNTIWWVIGIFSILALIYSLTAIKISKSSENVPTPVFSLIVFVVSLVFIIGGAGISSSIQNKFGISFIEARPSISGTFEVAKQSLIKNPIFGVGAGRFAQAWMQYKPLESNLSQLWNVDFRNGFGFIPTFIVASGIIGILTLLFFFENLLTKMITAIFRRNDDYFSSYIIVSSGLVTVYLWLLTIIYIPSIVTLFMTLVFTGVFIGSLYREGLLSVKKIEVNKDAKVGFIYIFSLVLFLVFLVVSGYHFAQRFLANSNYRMGVVAYNSGNPTLGENKVINAIALYPTDNYYRTLADIKLLKIGEILNNQNLTDDDRLGLFQNTLSEAISSIQGAIDYDKTYYLNYLTMANLYTDLTTIGIGGSAEEAQKYLDLAKERSPKNPAVVLNKARIEALKGNNEQARELIAESISLKQNYVEAVYLLSQIDVSEGNIERAIQNVRVAASVEPNNPAIFFQLGLLYYQNRQFAEAVSTFERAVILNPYFANAKYFLGLSYYQQGRTEDTILQFEDLEFLNPDNQEVKFILSNLRADQPPFEGVEPPLDNQPENRDQLPINEDEVDESVDLQGDIPSSDIEEDFVEEDLEI